MNVFNIIGPIMVGPSSSHTAGAVRLGRVANKVLNGHEPTEVDLELSGSFARTYRGHGTDRALLAGLMGYHSYDDEVRDALNIATARGIHYHFIPTDIPGTHPNTTRIRFRCADGFTGEVMGSSIGGGNIRVDEINGLRVDFTGENSTMLVLHDDVPGVIAEVTSLLRQRDEDLNISNFRLSRTERGGTALMTLEFDTMPSDDLKEAVEALNHVLNVMVLRAI